MIDVIDETDDFMVLKKPRGMDFHDCDGVPGFFTQLQDQSEERLFPVHRLDKVTSGLILVAKNKEACKELNAKFEAHEIEKYYLALSDRKPKKKQGWIIGDMERSRRSTWCLLQSKRNPAITQFFSYGLGFGCRMYILKPRTGQTHQLRVAMKAIGAAIVGDPLYYPGVFESDRCYLHAFVLRFELNGTDYCYVQPPTDGELFCRDETQAALKNLMEPWTLNWPKVK